MKLYVIYFRTMDDSPRTDIVCVTANKALADAEYRKAKAEERKFMADAMEEDSSDWIQAHRRTQSVPCDVKPGDHVKVAVFTDWMEFVDTKVKVFVDLKFAYKWLDGMRNDAIKAYGPGLQPFDENETLEESGHLQDPSVMVDVYCAIEDVIIR